MFYFVLVDLNPYIRIFYFLILKYSFDLKGELYLYTKIKLRKKNKREKLQIYL